MKKMADDDCIIRLFLKLVGAFGELEKLPRDFGVNHLLYPSEIHMLEAIGEEPGIKLTDLAKKLGITKGAIPKMSRKLERKGLMINYKSSDNKKEVLFKLADAGYTACDGHKKYHARFDKQIKRKLKLLNRTQKEFLQTVFTELVQYSEEMLRWEKKQ